MIYPTQTIRPSYTSPLLCSFRLCRLARVLQSTLQLVINSQFDFCLAFTHAKEAISTLQWKPSLILPTPSSALCIFRLRSSPLIWEAALPGHFDAYIRCLLPVKGKMRYEADGRLRERERLGMSQEDQVRYLKFKDMVFLDVLQVSQSAASRHVAYCIDSSMYRYNDSLKSTCVDSSRSTPSVWVHERQMHHTQKVNTIYLAGIDRRLQYNNETDVIHLRLGDEADEAIVVSNSVTPVSRRC